MIFHYYSTLIIETDCLQLVAFVQINFCTCKFNESTRFFLVVVDNYLSAYHVIRPIFGIVFQRSMIVEFCWQILSATRYLTC